MRPLEIAPTHAVADVGELAGRHDVAVAEDRVAGEVGTIKVEIWVARFKQSMLSEKQKKAVFVTHSARIGDPIGDYVCPASLGHPVNLAAVFVFENSRDIWPHSSYRSTRHPCSCSRSSTFLIHVDRISQEASSRIECS
ncbi:hypothetical protein BCR44DRAFT_1430628 [Catenaria anguillulae PL171]|uniref:Uncharacterized protein n=1 Tax=Catenaria anguillulae PL171 TaxID=765915 RepID=A0A1Y2HRD8_9FUNG|nr:hypothetical protein BCR44DRAFT_1430628 [Catenaria anguillulae PL171]